MNHHVIITTTFLWPKKITISKAKIQIRYWKNIGILEEIKVTIKYDNGLKNQQFRGVAND